jgi:hypothetical protein
VRGPYNDSPNISGKGAKKGNKCEEIQARKHMPS